MKKHFTFIVMLLLLGWKTMEAQQILSGTISSNMTLTSDKIWLLQGYVYVTNGATLTIEAGTLIKGDSVSLGSLIITRGSKISAIGTSTNPIVFTSAKAVGERRRGDWGGLILLGNATVNWPGDTGHVEGITPNPYTLYGGGATPNDADNSGTLQYVRIEFAGIALSPNNEINGLTMGGVGSGTTIDHVQVSYSNDDSYEWFGGTVRCKYIVAYDGIDDDFDTDNGFSGRVQFALGMRDPSVADVSGSKTFESDNDPTGSTNLPQTSVIFGNVTGLGGAVLTTNPNFKQSAHLRRNTNEKIYNSIMMGFPQGILIDGSSTIANCAASSLVKNCYVQEDTSNFLGFTPSGDPNEAAATTQLNGNGNIYSTQYSGVLVNPDFPITDVHNMYPANGNPLPAADNSVYGGDLFFTNVTYVGAFNPAGDTWADGWTNFDPQNEPYTGIETPKAVSTLKIYPNPMTTSSLLEFNLSESHEVNISIIDLSGRLIREVLNDQLAAGMHQITLQLGDLARGMYLVNIRTGEDNQMIKLNVD